MVSNPYQGCDFVAGIGDGICDIGANNILCDWDGGDCCGIIELCTLKCSSCHENVVTTSTTSKVYLTTTAEATAKPFVPPGLDDNFQPPGQQKND